MSERDRNVELVRSTLEAFDADDVTDVVAMLHPDVESHVSPPMMNSGTWHGIDGYFEMTGAWFEAWKGLRYDVVELEAPDDRHVLATLRQVATGRESGVPVEMDVVFLFEIEDGRARRFHVYADHGSAVAAL